MRDGIIVFGWRSPTSAERIYGALLIGVTDPKLLSSSLGQTEGSSEQVKVWAAVPRSGYETQPRVAALRGYPGKQFSCRLQPQRGCVSSRTPVSWSGGKIEPSLTNSDAGLDSVIVLHSTNETNRLRGCHNPVGVGVIRYLGSQGSRSGNPRLCSVTASR